MLTKIQERPQVKGSDAAAFLQGLVGRLRPVYLTDEEYVSAIVVSAESEVRGGTIYDALIAACARKAQAEVCYTWNLKHFRLLLPEFGEQVQTPPWPVEPSD